MENENETRDEVKEPETEPGKENQASDEERSKADARIAELEKALSDKDTEIGVLKKGNEDLETRCRTLGDSLAEAVTGYRTMVIQSNPDILSDMITGDSIEAINESLGSARVLVSRIRQGLETEITQVRVPSGSPERSSPDLSALSPAEKIRYALGGTE